MDDLTAIDTSSISLYTREKKSIQSFADGKMFIEWTLSLSIQSKDVNIADL